MLIEAHFDEARGIGYKLARTNIHSCDFSSGSYTYIDEGDKELKSFSIAEDKKYRIPFIKEALTATRGKLNIFARPLAPTGVHERQQRHPARRRVVARLDSRRSLQERA